MSVTSLPFQPVAIMLEDIKVAQRSGNMRLDGIDLDSGRRASLKIRFKDRDLLCRPARQSDGLVLLIGVERLID